MHGGKLKGHGDARCPRMSGPQAIRSEQDVAPTDQHEKPNDPQVIPNVPQRMWSATPVRPMLQASMPKSPPPLTARQVFARNLRRARRLKDVTQEMLAVEAGMPRAYVSRVERGNINISMDNADALAAAIGVPLRDLVDPTKFPGLDELP